MCAIKRDIVYNALANTTINNKGFDVNHLHKVFGHCGIEAVKNTAKIHNLQLFGKFEVCEDCAVERQSRKVSIKFGQVAAIFHEKEFILILV